MLMILLQSVKTEEIGKDVLLRDNLKVNESKAVTIKRGDKLSE